MPIEAFIEMEVELKRPSEWKKDENLLPFTVSLRDRKELVSVLDTHSEYMQKVLLFICEWNYLSFLMWCVRKCCKCEFKRKNASRYVWCHFNCVPFSIHCYDFYSNLSEIFCQIVVWLIHTQKDNAHRKVCYCCFCM